MTDLSTREPRMRLSSASKRFGNALALDSVDLVIAPGEIHALVGQNGSGKSTLIKILAGYHVPERGTALVVGGEPVRLPPRPRDLLAARVSFVHQDLGLLDDMSVAENVCVGQFQSSRFLHKINWKNQRALTARILEWLGVDIDPARMVATLSAAERAMVAIARGVLRQQDGAGLVVLDEATRALPPDSLGDVHKLIHRIADSGGAVLLVSHNLEEVMAISDRVTVLRDGKVVLAGAPTISTSEAELARHMLGSDLQTAVKGAPDLDGEHQFSVRGLTGATCTDISFELRHGEILGLTGLSGSGYEEVPYLLAGAARATRGEVTVGTRTRTLADSSISALRDFGVALVPERRERDGLAFEMTVADNITLPRLKARGSVWRVGNSWRRAEASAVIRDLDVRPPRPELLVRQLSGGNQQKVLLGKWLAGDPSVLVLHEPTQAVDVGARVDIISAIQSAAASGKAVVMASVDANDLAAVCNRVIVFERGRIKATLTTDARDDIIDTIYGGRITD